MLWILLLQLRNKITNTTHPPCFSHIFVFKQLRRVGVAVRNQLNLGWLRKLHQPYSYMLRFLSSVFCPQPPIPPIFYIFLVVCVEERNTGAVNNNPCSPRFPYSARLHTGYGTVLCILSSVLCLLSSATHPPLFYIFFRNITVCFCRSFDAKF